MRADMATWWGNGQRWLLIVFLGFLASVLLFGTMTLIAFVVTRQHEFTPLHNITPQIVHTPKVPVGGVVVVEGTKCNDSKEAIATEGETNVRNLDNGDLYRLRANAGVRDPGCTTRTFENQLTDDIPPGHYRMEGFDLAVSDSGQPQREPHFSQPFEIVGSE